jgi:hypothetical protein
MTSAQLELLKAHMNRLVEISTSTGERLIIRPISVFDEDTDPDVFFDDFTTNPEMKSKPEKGFSMPLVDIDSVKLFGGGDA